MTNVPWSLCDSRPVVQLFLVDFVGGGGGWAGGGGLVVLTWRKQSEPLVLRLRLKFDKTEFPAK